MGLQLYNTMGRKKQDFHPIHADHVGMYGCGPTVYDYQHIGNLRTYIFEDIVRRALEFNNYNVKHVMNITDVGHLTSDADIGEDKFMKTLRKLNLPPTVESMHAIAEKYTEIFFSDCAKLNILKPHVICNASKHVEDMIELIKRIEENGYTYTTQVGLIFDTQKFTSYSELANLKVDQHYAGARVDVDPERKSPADFALWINNQPTHLMQWDSPWGRGFPGWHIECSAMSMKYLGEHFDIHCGGQDHINVHHSNEIAQSEAATGKKWVNFWMHGIFLVLDKQKMSKSTGGFICVSNFEERNIDPLAYRYLCLTAHYRSELSFSWENLLVAEKAYKSLKDRIQMATQEEGELDETLQEKYEQEFRDFINDDLDMPQALALTWKVVKSNLAGSQKIALVTLFDQLLGLNLLEEKALPEWAKEKIIERENARKQKNWAESDKIRDLLKEKGILIEDHPDGTKWKFA